MAMIDYGAIAFKNGKLIWLYIFTLEWPYRLVSVSTLQTPRFCEGYGVTKLYASNGTVFINRISVYLCCTKDERQHF